MVKNPPAMQETQVQSLGQEDALEKETATHSSILAWRMGYSPWGSYSQTGPSDLSISSDPLFSFSFPSFY